jgi:hypothetical protein
MAREIPEVVRAAAGLAATVLDEARKIPETLPGLPVRVIGLAMQSAMKVQQQYAGFVARGDELFTGLRGEDEPGLATFDDELEDTDAAPASNGYRESAFDRAEVPLTEVQVTDDADHAVDAAAEKPARTKAAKAAKAARAPRTPREAPTPAEQVEDAQATLDALPAEAPSTEEVLEELAIDEMVGDAAVTDADADVTADVATTADVLTPDGEVATVEASVTDEGVAAPEAAPSEAAGDTAIDEGGTPVAAATGTPPEGGGNDSAPAPTTAPIDGYDSFSIAQLRGRLRGYALSTVTDLVAYEEATRAREPYLRLLRNRLEKVQDQAVESSPLAPRGL